MECRDLILDGLARTEEGLRHALKDLSAEQLAWRPTEGANSIGWLAWHLTRIQDDHVAHLAGLGQAWLEEGWHQRFGRPADKDDTGYGHGPNEVASVRPDSPRVLLEYHAAVYARTRAYLQTITCADLDRVVDTRWDPPVTAGVRLVSVVDDCAQHMGQLSFVRGLLPPV
jgi:uncharacterized damage-inducible protein DinB